MPKVRELVEAVLNRIETLVSDNDGIPKESQDLNILIRYEFEWALQGLRVILTKMLSKEGRPEQAPDPDSEITDANIQYLADTFLATRWALIKGTDATYNHRPLSQANQAYTILAEELANAFNMLHRDDINEDATEAAKHAYHYLFPDVDIDRYISTKGKLSDLALNEFFWSDDFTPIETLSALDKYHELSAAGNDTLPVHSCLDEKDLARIKNQQVNHNELSRLLSHSPAAQNYYLSITHAKRTNDWEGVASKREDLLRQLGSQHVGPFYHYKSSSENLLDKDWLKTVGVYDLYGLAKVLQERVRKQDWKKFLEALEQADNYLDKLLLPNDQGRPDETIFKHGYSNKFYAFINNPTLYGNQQDSTDHYRAVLYILTELYSYHRSNYAPYTGSVSHLTEGGIGYSRENKVHAAEVFQEFLQSDDYYLNQLHTFLHNTGNTIHWDALRSDRLGMLSDKAQSFGPSADDSANSLATVAGQLMQLDKSEWQTFMNDFQDNELQIYIDSNGGLTSCIQSSAHYHQGDDDYNKAVLYILAECYYRERSRLGVHKGAYSEKISNYTRGIFGGYNKDDKIGAIKVFQDFLLSDKKPNQLDAYLKEVGKQQHEGALRDKYSFNSELKALVNQAEEVCKPEYYLQPVVSQTAQAVQSVKQWIPFM